MKKNICFYIIVIIILQSCTNPKEIYNSWMGSHKSKMIIQWGPPTRTVSDGNGGEILIYEKKPIQNNYKSTDDDKGKSAGQRGYERAGQNMQNMVHYTDMYSDANGLLYHWRTGMR